MKRLIKYHNQFRSDENKFSGCGTKYEVLQILVDDDAGPKELKQLARQLGFKTKGKPSQLEVKTNYGGTVRPLQITHSIALNETIQRHNEKYQVYLGFITLNESGTLKPSQKIIKTTKKQQQDILDKQEYSIIDVIDLQGDRNILITSWEHYHHIPLLGYDFKHFQMSILRTRSETNISTVFDDSVFSCGECGAWDYNDDGYTYNYRMTDYDLLGTKCGCYEEHQKNNLNKYINNPDKPLESEVADALESEGSLERLETFIGGMVDGRGGYFKGQSTREGSPEDVINEYQDKYPDDELVLIHEESGQFQTYFSIARLT